MKISKSFETRIKIIINYNLYKKNIISENTYNIVNNKLLKELNRKDYYEL